MADPTDLAYTPPEQANAYGPAVGPTRQTDLNNIAMTGGRINASMARQQAIIDQMKAEQNALQKQPMTWR